MKLHAIVFAVLGIFILGSSPANAATKFSIFGDGTFSNYTVSGGVASIVGTRKLGIGGGAQAEFGVGQNMGLEIGAVYLPRKLGLNGGTATFTSLEIPVQLRIWAGKMVSFGIGGFYDMAMGDVKFSDGTTMDYTAFGFKKANYGAIGSMGVNMPISPTAALFFEGRYTLGLANLNDPAIPAVTTKWSDIQVLAGLRFGGMK